MSEKLHFVDILEPRNTQFGIFKFMTRPWIPKKTFNANSNCTPQELKEMIAGSTYMDSFIEAVRILNIL